MFKAGLLSLFIVLAVAGCGTHLSSYELDSPGNGGDSVYVSNDIVIEMDIVDDSMYGLTINNKTDNPMLVLWRSASAVNADGEQVDIGFLVHEGGDDTGRGFTRINPGSRIYAEVFPAENAYTGEDGEPGHYPLYCVGSRQGSPSDLDGRLIGVRLLVEMNKQTRLLPLMLKVNPSMAGL